MSSSNTASRSRVSHRASVAAQLALGAGAVFLAGGCPGQLPVGFEGMEAGTRETGSAGGETGGTGGDAGATETPTACNAETDVFLPRCGSASCHKTASTSTGSIDLVSPGIAARLVGKPSADCSGQILIQPTLPAAGFLLDKLTKSMPQCGARMPFLKSALPPNEIECVKQWMTAAVMASGGADAGALDVPPGDTQAADMAVGSDARDGSSPDTVGDVPRETSPVDAPPPVRFSMDVQPILTMRCATAMCHDNSMPSAGLNLGMGSRVRLVGVNAGQCTPARPLVKASDSAGSYLIHKLKGMMICGSGMRMPRGGTALPAAQIDLISAWIDQGALDN